VSPADIFNLSNLKFAFWLVASATFIIVALKEENGFFNRAMSSLFASAIMGVTALMLVFVVGMGARFVTTKERSTSPEFVANYEHCKSLLQRKIDRENEYFSIDNAKSEQEAIEVAKAQFSIESQKRQRMADWRSCRESEDVRVASIPGYIPNENGIERIWIWQ